MSTVKPMTEDEIITALRESELEVMTSYTLADAIREGSTVTDQSVGGWGAGPNACALSAAYLATKARGYIA